MAPKSGVPFEKWLQKVEHPIEQMTSRKIYSLTRWVKKWSTFRKVAPKSGVSFHKVLQKVEYLYKYQGF